MDAESRSPRGTSTSNFGVGKRESHDSTAFYERFTAPELTTDEYVAPIAVENTIWCGDARDMDGAGRIADNSVALVVTSPPYFAGKAYEEAMGEGHVPASYVEYLEMLRDVFAECRRKLQPGGRIAVNVANLGRKPYRSLSADVIRILQDDLQMLLRGEIIWRKAEGAGGSCAWGSFQSPSNPVLRDTSERVIIASKGRFDRALSQRRRRERKHPCKVTISVDEFLDSTLDVWDHLPPESARNVGHPAPFPVGLPQRLIQLYTYKDELVLDPFMGAGTTAIAAIRTERRYVGFDTDEEYCALAENRIDLARREQSEASARMPQVEFPLALEPADGELEAVGFQSRSSREGKKARQIAHELLEYCGFTDIVEDRKLSAIGVEVNFTATAPTGREWFFDVSGAFSSTRPGLRRTDTLWKALGKAFVIRQAYPDTPLVFLTTDRPDPSSAGGKALSQVAGEGKSVDMVVEMYDDIDRERLIKLAQGEH